MKLRPSMRSRYLVLLVALGASLPDTPPSPGIAQPAGPGTASVSGIVSFEGAAAAPELLPVTRDAFCQALHPQGLETRAVEVQRGGLAHVLVYVKTGLAATPPAPSEPALIEQRACVYVPPLVAVQVGQPLRIRNNDNTFHNVHSWSTVNPAFNIAQPRQGMEATRTFDKPELLIPVRCDIHPWMRAFVSVVAHPYHAVTGADGTFSIQGLPGGDYEIEAVHAQLKAIASRITLKDGEAAKLNFKLKG